jgi:hypothetical protein
MSQHNNSMYIATITEMKNGLVVARS